MNKAVTLAFLGDVMLGRKISRALPQRGPDWFWGDALPILRAADTVFANLESPIAAGPLSRNAWKTFHFRAEPATVDILTSGNVGFVCLANNHTLDFGPEGMRQTLSILDSAGIKHAGAGVTRSDAEAPCIVALPGLTVGVMAATDNMRTFAAGTARAGTNFVGTMTGKQRGLDWVARSVDALKRTGVDLIVLALHWGPNMRTVPPSWFRSFAHGAIERGVDIVHGHSAHVFQGVERYGDGVILYDTGNFIDDYWKFPFRKTFWTFIFQFEIDAERCWRLKLVPMLVHKTDHMAPPSMPAGDVAAAIRERMRRCCAELGTVTVDAADGLIIPGGALRIATAPRPHIAAAQ